MKILLLSTTLLAAATTDAFVARQPSFHHPTTTKLYSQSAQANDPEYYTIPLEKIGLDDLPKVGGKTASLGEMIQRLTPLGVDVPGGFGVSSTAYDAVLDRFELRERLELLMKDVDGKIDVLIHLFLSRLRLQDHTSPANTPPPRLTLTSAVTNLEDLAERGHQARQMIVHAGLPDDVRLAIEQSYEKMCKEVNGGGEFGNISVAVRSSATAEDLPTASFAGQQASFLNVVGKRAVADAVLECLASIFTDRAITYRVENDFPHMQVKGAVVVQLMVRSDLASSGVAFTLDPDTGFRDVCVITGSYGLGESVVGGKVDPDEVQVYKPTIDTASDPIIQRRIGRKQTQIVYTSGVSHTRVKTIETSKLDQSKRCFSDEDAKIVAKWCADIEKYYSEFHGRPTPMDIE